VPLGKHGGVPLPPGAASELLAKQSTVPEDIVAFGRVKFACEKALKGAKRNNSTEGTQAANSRTNRCLEYT
jgi:hypothetical protein